MYTGPLHPIFLNNRPAAHYFFKFQITVTQAFLIIARTEMGSHSLVLIAIQVMTKLLAITLRIIAITITIMAKKLIDYCNNQ